jgi:hypothetical protein
MTAFLNSVIQKLAQQPKLVFLIDGVGAGISAAVLLAVIQPFPVFWGIPSHVVTALVLPAILLALFSGGCYLFLKNNFGPLIRFVAVANLAYCLLVLVLALQYASVLTIMGKAYTVIELFIIGTLVYLELKVANVCTHKKV